MSTSPRVSYKMQNETRTLSFTPGVESKFDELKSEVVQKIEKELGDSHNAREYISKKYDELCNKISYLTELDSTVNGFRSDVQSIEKQIGELTQRVDQIEKKAIRKECGSIKSSNILNMANMPNPYLTHQDTTELLRCIKHPYANLQTTPERL